MRPKRMFGAILISVSVAVVFVVGTLMGREDYMRSLPVYNHYKCLLCHNSGNPITADLNSFGLDFKKNDYIWNNTLALKDSDGDTYANGVELGDVAGDGTAEVGFERSNPGDRFNTPSSVNMKTWGILKSLFEDRK